MVGAAAVSIVWWAADTATTTSIRPLPAGSDGAVYEVSNGSIGRSVDFSVDAEWARIEWGLLGRSGTVTSIDAVSGSMLSAGDTILSIDLQPVIAATGNTPSFRSLAIGAVGSDVEQLHAFLTAGGFYSGEVAAEFTRETKRAVRAWQKAMLGKGRDTGVVELGDLMFIPGLPRRVGYSDWLKVGVMSERGLPVLQLLAPAPTFQTRLADDQFDLVPPGAPVEVVGTSWAGVVSTVERDPTTGGFIASLLQSAGGALCGLECDAVPVDGTSYRASVEVVPSLSGTVVPASSLVSRASGGVAVRMANGGLRDVVVVGADGGIVVVDGIEVGALIRVYGEPG